MSFSPRSAGIGVFDSGVGGLSVLKALREALPDVALHYVADSAHAPYGEREPAFIAERSLALAEHLVAQGARLLVVACNTATAHAAERLRARWPGLPIVGIEPGIKPAVQASRNGRIGVLATPATVRSERFQALLARHAHGVQVLAQPCSGVVALIEAGQQDSPELITLIERYCAPLRDAEVDTALLGCTHYPLVRSLWQAALPGVNLLQIEAAVAAQAARLWPAASVASSAAQSAKAADARLRLQSTGDAALLQRLARQALGEHDLQASALVL